MGDGGTWAARARAFTAGQNRYYEKLVSGRCMRAKVGADNIWRLALTAVILGAVMLLARCSPAPAAPSERIVQEAQAPGDLSICRGCRMMEAGFDLAGTNHEGERLQLALPARSALEQPNP
jgi:hypothetical protein